MYEPEIVEALREYYETHNYHIKLEDGSLMLVTQEGRQPDPVPEFDQPNYDAYDNPDQSYPVYGDYNDEALRNTDVKQGEEDEEMKQYEQPIPVAATAIAGITNFAYIDGLSKQKFSFHPITLESRVEQEGAGDESLPS